MKKKRLIPVPNEIDQMERAAFPLIEVPFNGKKAVVKVRRLSQAQIRACGNVTLIETFQDKLFNQQKAREITLAQRVEKAEFDYSIIRNTLISPKYDDIYNMLLENINNNTDNINKQFKDIKQTIDDLEIKDRNDKMVPILKNELARLEILYKFIMPPDFISYVQAYGLSMDESDIADVCEDGLYEAAILAVKGHDNPADHYSGLFTDHNKDDINKRAWIIYHERQNKQG